MLVSDLLTPEDPWPTVSRLADGASAAWIIQLLARQDADPAWNGDLRLVDSEGGGMRELRLEAAAVSRYREALRRLREQWHRACGRAGVRLVEVVAEDVLDGGRWSGLRELARAELLRVA